MTAAVLCRTRPPILPTKLVRFPPTPEDPIFLRGSTRKAQRHKPVLTQKLAPPVEQEQCAVPTFERQRLQSQVLQSPPAQQATRLSAQTPEPVPVQREEWEAIGQSSPSFARQTK